MSKVPMPKSTFPNPDLAVLAHELRTPLTAIIGYAEAMIGGPLGPVENAKHREYLESVLASARHALSLVDGLQRGPESAPIEPADLAEIAKTCVAAVQPIADARSIALTFEAVAGLPPVKAGEQALRQVLFNLLSNALKFTPPGGKVRVAVAMDKGAAQLAVSDTGTGLNAETLARLLRDRPAEASLKVGGLGLPVSRALIAGFDGELTIESQPGQGSIFSIRIPLWQNS